MTESDANSSGKMCEVGQLHGKPYSPSGLNGKKATDQSDCVNAPSKPAERRRRTLRVVASNEEAEAIGGAAAAMRQSVSTYLRNLGLGHRPASRLDQQLMLGLIKVNADQGRLGGLLKLWLSERPGAGASAFEVRKLLRQIEETQSRLKEIAERL